MKCRKCQGESPSLSPWHLCLRCEADRLLLRNARRSFHPNMPDGPWCDFDRDKYKPSNIGRSLDQENAEKLLSCLRDMGAIDEDSHSSEGFLRRETGLTVREYRRAIRILKAEKAVRTKPRVGTWLVS